MRSGADFFIVVYTLQHSDYMIYMGGYRSAKVRGERHQCNMTCLARLQGTGLLRD